MNILDFMRADVANSDCNDDKRNISFYMCLIFYLTFPIR